MSHISTISTYEGGYQIGTSKTHFVVTDEFIMDELQELNAYRKSDAYWVCLERDGEVAHYTLQGGVGGRLNKTKATRFVPGTRIDAARSEAFIEAAREAIAARPECAMLSSAQLCLSDACRLHDAGAYHLAAARSLTSMKYAVGVFSQKYLNCQALYQMLTKVAPNS